MQVVMSARSCEDSSPYPGGTAQHADTYLVHQALTTSILYNLFSSQDGRSTTRMDPSQWPSLSQPDPEMQAALQANPRPPLELNDVSQLPPLREEMDKSILEELYSRLDFSGIEQETVEIPLRDGLSSASLVFKSSTKPATAGALAVLFHGGGWVFEHAESEALSAVPLVKDFGCIVVSVEYRLAPEHPFPKGINDCWDALQWCASNASALNADPSIGFLIGGDSSGGNAAAVLQHLARDTKLQPPVTGAWLAYPLTVAKECIPEIFVAEYTSRDQNVGPFDLPSKTRDFMKNCYAPDPKSELFAPLNWPSGHAGLARTFVHVCGLDQLRDDGLLYERELRRAGVETKLAVYPGCPHAVDLMSPKLAQVKKFEEDRREAFRWLLRKE